MSVGLALVRFPGYLLIILSMLLSTTQRTPAAQPEDLLQEFNRAQLLIETTNSGCVLFNVYIATNSQQRSQGLMYIRSMAADEGMLFVFDAPERHAFWMRNCKVNLDIIWIDANRRVVEIAHDQAPCPAEGTCPNIFPMRSASYVLEVAGGTAHREGLGLGDPVALYLEQSNGD
jgi:uncharacterized membrane protein (UPF0127 family)